MQYFQKVNQENGRRCFFRKFILNIFLKEGEKLYFAVQKLRYKYNNNYLAK